MTTSGKDRSAPKPLPLHTRTTILYGVLCFVLLITIVQLWLLTATMHSYLDGETSLIVPGAMASIVCLLLNVGLLRYLYRLER